MAMSMNSKPRVFISYARKDGEAFALKLRQRLETEESEITLWQDRAKLEGGVGWRKQITDALDEVQFLLLVLTPAAVISPIVRWEWQYARQRGVCVYPIKGAPDSELAFRDMPQWMSKIHFFDIEHEWTTFVQYLKSPCQVNRIPFTAPDRPSAFIDRPKEFLEIKSHLLDPIRGDAVAITTALQGSGGFGKTTLAIALCHDDDIITAYDDGILWVTLGEKPNLVQALTKLYDALTGERPVFVDVENAAFNLRQKLENRNCLLVLDDVWDPIHLKPFLFRTSKCAHLVTTRQFDVAAGTKKRVIVDEMTSTEAIELLTANLDSHPDDLRPFRALAERLGEWPLLLKLAASTLQQRLARGNSHQSALLYLNTALDKRGVIAFDRNDAIDREAAVSKTIDVSLELLTLSERDRYRQLAIFPEDTDIPLSIVAALWGTDSFETEQLAERMDNFGLLEFNLQTATLRLHDALRAYIGLQLTDAALLHGKLVEAFGDFREMKEPYAWKWIAFHLVGAGRKDRLLELLLNYDWLNAKLRASDCSALIADFEYVVVEGKAKEVRDTLRLSAHILASDKTQLFSQLYGRMKIGTKTRHNDLPWLRPAWPSLTQAGGALIRTLVGHRGWVRRLLITSDGQQIVSGSDDKAIKLWDFNTGAELRTLMGHEAGIRSLAISRDGTRLVSGDAQGVVIVWDLLKGVELESTVAHINDVCAIALTQDGKHVVTASDDRTIRVWEIVGLRHVHIIAGHQFWVTGVATTPDGRIVTVSGDRTLKIWDLASGAELAKLKGHYDVINGLAVTPDFRQAISVGDDMKLVLWDLEKKEMRYELFGHGGKVLSVAIMADGKRAISGSADCTVRLWDLENGREAGRITAHTDDISAIAATPDGCFAVSGSADHSIKVWEIDAIKKGWIYADHGHSTRVNVLEVIPGKNIAISGSAGGTIRLWSLDTGAQRDRLEGAHAGGVRAIAVTSDGNYCVSASNDETVRIWDLNKLEQIHKLVGHVVLVQSVAITPDGRYVVSGSADCTLAVWDFRSGKRKFVLCGHERAISMVLVTPDSKLAVSSSLDRTVRVWDIASGQQIYVLQGHDRRIEALALTPNGELALSGGYDHKVNAWSIRDGSLLCSFDGHVKPITKLVAGADGNTIVSGSEDGVIKVWSLRDKTCIHTFALHTYVISGLRICNSTEKLISASKDNTVRVWDLRSGELVATFTAESPLQCVCAVSDGTSLAIGETSGKVHVLHLETKHGL